MLKYTQVISTSFYRAPPCERDLGDRDIPPARAAASHITLTEESPCAFGNL